MAAAQDQARDQVPADAFVSFGVSGDLARKMTFVALYRLERAGRLECPVIGVAVDDWSDDDLRQHARDAVTASIGADARGVDADALERLVARMRYVGGDFADAATYQRLADTLGETRHPVFYLEIPPSLFEMAIKGLSDAGLTEHARVVVENPFGHDLVSAQALNASLRATVTNASPNHPLGRGVSGHS